MSNQTSIKAQSNKLSQMSNQSSNQAIKLSQMSNQVKQAIKLKQSSPIKPNQAQSIEQAIKLIN